MRLAFSKSFVQEPCNHTLENLSATEREQIVSRLVQSVGVSPQQAATEQDGTLRFTGMPNGDLHMLTLEAEKMGLSVRYTKQTLIEIC